MPNDSVSQVSPNPVNPVNSKEVGQPPDSPLSL